MHQVGRVALIVNARSRRGEEWFESARAALIAGGAEVVEAESFRAMPLLRSAVARLVKDRMPLIAIGGGDGTFSHIARHFANSESVMGVLPLGTGNSFARDLGIPTDVEAACDAILNGQVADVDLGHIGDRDFVNVATVGVSTLIAQGLDKGLKRRFGRAAYVLSIARALALAKPFEVRLEGPSGVREFTSLQVVIGNGRFHAGPFRITPEASITGGRLAIYALASGSKADFLRMASHLVVGSHVHMPEVVSFQADHGKISTTPVQRITLDGEVCLRTPVEFSISPGALKVMVPTP